LTSATGVKTLLGELDSPDLADIAAQYDVVLHTADADHVAGAESIVAGLERRVEASGRKPIFIHTSGTGVLIDTTEGPGSVKTENIFSDGELASYHALPATNIHKNVDDIVLESGRRRKIDAVIVCPPTIWGLGQGEFNRHSIQVPLYTQFVLKTGEGIVLESGVNTWSIINVADLSAAYLAILEAAVDGKLPSDPNERVFFVENEEYEQRDVAETVTRELYGKGKLSSPAVKSVTLEQTAKYGAGRRNPMLFTGLNSRSRGVKLRALGWEPKKGGKKEFLESIKDDVDHVIAGHHRLH
jgi:nucleoside-diphosphate-sugar epimerase